MAFTCRECGKKVTIFNRGMEEDLCTDCSIRLTSKRIVEAPKEKEAEELRIAKEAAEAAEREAYILNTILVTTLPAFEGKKIIKYFDVISEESFIGTGFLSELSASISDMLGTRSEAFSNKTNIAKANAIKMLKTRAFEMGANAVIGAEVEYMITNYNMIMYSVAGTPVLVEEIE